MATSAVAVQRPTNPDRIFYPAMCVVVLITVWLGFAKTYYAAGMIHAPLPSRMVHVHAIAFTLWLLTLVVQTALVSVRKVKLHMAVGLWGFGLAAAMVALGLIAARGSLRRNFSPPNSGLSALTFFVVPFTDIVVFALLAGWSYAVRRKPQEHKRLIMIATIVLLDAAIARFQFTITPMGPLALTIIFFSFLLVIVLYDIATLKRVHRVTWVSSLIVVVMTLTRIPLGQTAAWQHFAGMIAK